MLLLKQVKEITPAEAQELLRDSTRRVTRFSNRLTIIFSERKALIGDLEELIYEMPPYPGLADRRDQVRQLLGTVNNSYQVIDELKRDIEGVRVFVNKQLI